MFAPAMRPRLAAALPKPPALTRTYTRAAHPNMPTTAPLRNLLRSSTLRASSTAAQRAYALSSSSRARTPSPPPPYTVRGISVQAGASWTRFRTPLTLSSVRTFSSTPRASWPAEGAAAAVEIAPEAAQKIDAAIEEITELFATAKDEFEIAAEETERNTTYAEDDRAAAREELDKLLDFYRGIVEGGDKVIADEVKRRVGHRIRELEHAMIALEEAAMHHD